MIHAGQEITDPDEILPNLDDWTDRSIVARFLGVDFQEVPPGFEAPR